MKNRIFLLFFFIMGIAMLYSEETVKIYFTNFNYLRRAGLTETSVRNIPDIFIQINDKEEIERLIKHLDYSGMEEQGYVDSDWADIVIDFIRDGMIYETYILNKFYFYRKGDHVKYKTPEVFLKIYTLYGF